MNVKPVSMLKYLNVTEVNRESAQEAFDQNMTVLIQVGDSLLESSVLDDMTLPVIADAKYYALKPYDDEKVIVTRHPGIAQWFRKYKGINAPVIATARPRDVKGKIIYTSGINLGLLNYAIGAYVVKVPRQSDVNFDMLTADQLNELSPKLTWAVSTELLMEDDADITKPIPVYLTTRETVKEGDQSKTVYERDKVSHL